MAVETFLQDLGHRVVGPFAHLCDALLAAAREPVDAALLDVNLADEMVFPLAEALHERGVPFLLVSGCDDARCARPTGSGPAWPSPAEWRKRFPS